jgi:MFS family permease
MEVSDQIWINLLFQNGAKSAISRSMDDRKVLYAATMLRALGVGMIAVLIGIYPAKLGIGKGEIGFIVSAGLLGVASAALLATVAADRWGRRRMLVQLALLGAAGGAAAAWASSPWALFAAAFFGMINGMGQDRGASLVIEQSILPATTTHETRTQVFAWYNLLQDTGHALGGLMAGLPTVLERLFGVAELPAFRIALGVYAAFGLATAGLYLALSPAVESTAGPLERKVAPESRRMLWKISSLFALDSLGGGFFTTALLSLFFFDRFGIQEAALGLLFFGSRLLNAVSHLGAAWLAKRIGLVNTMVFTHIPSSLLFVTVAFAPNATIAVIFFLMREGLVEMDVPTRQSYVMAVVRPEERMLAAGVTNLVRVAAWSVAPTLAGLFMQGGSMVTPLLIGVSMKVLYDVLLYVACRKNLPPEER